MRRDGGQRPLRYSVPGNFTWDVYVHLLMQLYWGIVCWSESVCVCV